MGVGHRSPRSGVDNVAFFRSCRGAVLVQLVYVSFFPFFFSLAHGLTGEFVAACEATLYELRSTAAIDKKRGLLIEVAKWSGDGLRTSCLKMPPS